MTQSIKMCVCLYLSSPGRKVAPEFFIYIFPEASWGPVEVIDDSGFQVAFFFFNLQVSVSFLDSPSTLQTESWGVSS